MAYFITFHTYGTWLHGAEAGSVDDEHNRPGAPFVPPNELRRRFETSRFTQQAVTFDANQRSNVDRTIREVCGHRRWIVHALNVRSTHVHVVVTGPASPERMMNDLKSWCTRRLRERGLIGRDVKTWTRHGSTRYLWDEQSVHAACDYTLNRQGKTLPMGDPPETAPEDRQSEPRP